MNLPHASLRTAASAARDTAEAVAELSAALGELDAGVVFTFHSIAHDAHDVAALVKARFPEALCVGCSTMGELGPLGFTRGGLAALAMPAPACASAALVDVGAAQHFSQGDALASALAGGIGRSPQALSPDRHVLVTLTEGLLGSEERLIASLSLMLPRLPLVGGSAGDDYRMERTWVQLNGEARQDASLVVLLEPGRPFLPFAIHHYSPVERRVVVTRADPERRRIYELNGWLAAKVVAELLGVTPEALADNPNLPAEREHAFAYSVGGELFMRSVMRVEGDGLLMGGAVEEGVVLRVMRGDDLVEGTRDGLRRALEALPGEPEAMLLFNCGGRLMLSEVQGRQEALFQAMSPVPVAGFSTYGEQFGPLQVNQTLTGLVFGR